MPQPTIFLDRDGTINFDPGYLNNPDAVRLIEGAGAALKLLKDAGYLLLVISNQSGIARGLITDEQVGRVNSRINELLEHHTKDIGQQFFSSLDIESMKHAIIGTDIQQWTASNGTSAECGV